MSYVKQTAAPQGLRLVVILTTNLPVIRVHPRRSVNCKSNCYK